MVTSSLMATITFTARAVKLFQKHFGRDVAVYFVFGGTGANVLGLKAITKSHHAIICAETAHVNVDECGAPEKFHRMQIASPLPLPTANFESNRSNHCCMPSATNTTCSPG